MGCPVPKVANRAGAGSALLKDPEKVFQLVKSVCENVSVPVTVKIRSGWDSNSINAVEIAKLIEKAGGSAVCVHARTRSQGYSGKADFDVIKKVSESVSIPVIGNGDIKNEVFAKRMLDETGCTAIMIGRAALGNPWIIQNTVNYLSGKDIIAVDYEDKIKMIKKHLDYLIKNKGEILAIKEMRTQVSYYLKGMPKSSEIKPLLFKTLTKHDFTLILDKYLEKLMEI